jgi:hypothetical protein
MLRLFAFVASGGASIVLALYATIFPVSPTADAAARLQYNLIVCAIAAVAILGLIIIAVLDYRERDAAKALSIAQSNAAKSERLLNLRAEALSFMQDLFNLTHEGKDEYLESQWRSVAFSLGQDVGIEPIATRAELLEKYSAITANAHKQYLAHFNIKARSFCEKVAANQLKCHPKMLDLIERLSYADAGIRLIDIHDLANEFGALAHSLRAEHLDK